MRFAPTSELNGSRASALAPTETTKSARCMFATSRLTVASIAAHAVYSARLQSPPPAPVQRSDPTLQWIPSKPCELIHLSISRPNKMGKERPQFSTGTAISSRTARRPAAPSRATCVGVRVMFGLEVCPWRSTWIDWTTTVE